MPEITLHAEVGRSLGSRPARRLRAEGKIPGVVYGHGTDPVPVAVVARDLRVALSGESGTNALLNLDTGQATYLALARVLQRHPVKGTVTHIDFQIVRRDEVIAADVPVNLVGDAVEVNHGDGMVDQVLFTLPVNAKPADIPTAIDVDISALTIGGAIRIAELVLPSGVTTDLDDDAVVVSGQPGKVQAAAQGAEGEAAEAAAGAAAEAAGAAAEAEPAGE
ncbi:MAG TPA: 50S ribosomal protein L25 [Acidimicrobiales bacterium]|nr:50S ribosomal protein L25 [Acidimicrobiales bacterium]